LEICGSRYYKRWKEEGLPKSRIDETIKNLASRDVEDKIKKFVGG